MRFLSIRITLNQIMGNTRQAAVRYCIMPEDGGPRSAFFDHVRPSLTHAAACRIDG